MEKGEKQILTIELDGIDVCAREDAHERMAHLSPREITGRSDNADRSSVNKSDTHLVKADGEQPASTRS